MVDFLLYLATPTLVYEVNFPRRASFRPFYFLGHSFMCLANLVSSPYSLCSYAVYNSHTHGALTLFLIVHSVRSVDWGYHSSGEVKPISANLRTVSQTADVSHSTDHSHDILPVWVNAKRHLRVDSLRRQRVLSRLVELNEYWRVLWKVAQIPLLVLLQTCVHEVAYQVQDESKYG